MTKAAAKAGSLGTDLLRMCALLWRGGHALLPPLLRRTVGLPVSDAEIGDRLRIYLDQSGVVTRKLGQFLALRFDLLPRDICERLDKLFDSAQPMNFATVSAIIESELTKPLPELFQSFDEAPIATASIAQVHRAVACDGQVLAIKVQRAGIEQAFFSEIRNLRRLARASDFLRLTGSLSATEALDEFAAFTEAELHFDREGTTADRLRAGLRPGCHVPEIRWDLTTTRVLAMEFIEGITILAICRMYESGNAAAIARALPGVDLADTVNRIADECLHQIFDTGFFHGDPNPGNILIRKDGSFVFVDCGIFGEITRQERQDLIGYQEALVRGRFRQSARYYIRLSEPTSATRIPALEDDLAALLAQWHRALSDPSLPIAKRHLSVWQGRVVRLLRRHHVRTRPNLLLVWRAYMFLDATSLRLPLRFDGLAAQTRFFSRRQILVALERLGPGSVRNEILGLATAAPKTAAFLRRLLTSNPTISGHRSREVRFAATANRSARQLAVAILSVAVTVFLTALPAEWLAQLGVWLADRMAVR